MGLHDECVYIYCGGWVKFGKHTDYDTRLGIRCDVYKVTTKLSPYPT